MRLRGRLAVVGATLTAGVAVVACAQVLGIDGEYGDLPTDASSGIPEPDGSVDARDSALDAMSDAVTDRISLPCERAPGACVEALPEGFELVLVAADRNTACPTAFTEQDVVADPIPAAGACDCACSVGSDPSCTTGTMSTRHATMPSDTSCASQGVSLNLSGSGCTSLNGTFSTYFSATPLPATVTCDASALLDSTKVTSTELRVCVVPTECGEEICADAAPAGFSTCIAGDGDVPCPSGWDTRTVIGDSADLSCTACTCEASASCTGGSISFFSDGACNTLLVTFDVNDSCQATNDPGPIGGFMYSASVTDAACTADGPKTASVTLTAARTVCCK